MTAVKEVRAGALAVLAGQAAACAVLVWLTARWNLSLRTSIAAAVAITAVALTAVTALYN